MPTKHQGQERIEKLEADLAALAERVEKLEPKKAPAKAPAKAAETPES